MPLYFARSSKEDRVLLVGLRAGSLTGFAALRCDLRGILHLLCALLTAFAAARRLLRRCA